MNSTFAILSICLVCLVMSPSVFAQPGSARPQTFRIAPERGQAFMPWLVDRTLPEPLVRAVEAGKLAEAEAWIAARLADPATDAGLRVRCEIEKERLRRLREDFSRTPEQMLERIRKDIPDATAEDLQRWADKGEIQWNIIDGQMFYFRREPGALLRFCEEAIARRDAAKKAATASAAASPTPAAAAPQATKAPALLGDSTAALGQEADKDEIIANVVKLHETQGGEFVYPVKIRATHTITIEGGKVPAGQTVRCWMPFPQEYRQQRDVRLLATSPAARTVAPGGPGTQRTLYMEQPAAAEGGKTIFTAEYEFTSSAYISPARADLVTPYTPGNPIVAQYTCEQPPHILLTPDVRRLAAEIVGGETNPYRKAEKIFRWMDANTRWTPEIEYCLIPSAIEKIMATRKGDCGIQSLMFISLCRAVGVPARWQSGWVTPPDDWNLHDWAEFYVEPFGWVPADPSNGLRKSDDPRIRDFYIGALDPYRMIANLEIMSLYEPPKKHWRSDPVDNQRGEVEWEGGNLYFGDWSYDVKLEYLNAQP